MARHPGQFRTPYDAIGGAMATAARSISTSVISDALDVINVRSAPYNAVGDGVADDTAAFQAALAAALLIPNPFILVPPGTYMVQDPTTGDHSAAADGPIWIDPDFRELVVSGYGATILIGPNGVSSSAIRLFGSRCRIEGLVVDVNSDVPPASKGNTAFEINGTTTVSIGAVEGVSGCDNEIVDCRAINGHKDDPDVNQGENSFVVINGYRNAFENCWSYDCGWNAFVVAGGSENRINECGSLDQRGSGMRIQGEVGVLWIDGFHCRSLINSGRHAIIFDSSSSETEGTRCRLAIVKNCDLYLNPTVSGDVPTGGSTDGSSTTFKLAAVDLAFISNCKIGAGTGLSNRCFRLEDCIGRAVFRECEFNGPGGFNPVAASGSTVYGGVPSAQANDGGFVQFTLGSGHGLIEGKSLYVKGSSIGSYNREHIITSAAATTVTTNVAYTAGALGANIWAHSGVERVDFIDCEFNHELTAGGSYHIHDAAARILNFERCEFLALQSSTGKLAGIDWDLANDLGFDLIRFVDTNFTFNSTNICKGLRPANQATMVLTSGKTIGLRSGIKNLAGGGALFVDVNASGDGSTPYPNRATLFNSDGDRTGCYRAAATPTGTDVAFQVGDQIRLTTPAAGGSGAVVCTAAGSVGVSVGTFKGLGVVDGPRPLATVLNVSTDDASAKNLLSYAIPAGLMSRTGDRISLYANFQWFNASVTKKVRILYGATAMWGTNDVSSGAGARFVIRAEYVRKADGNVDWSVTYIEDGTDVGELFCQQGVATTWDAGTTFIIEGDAGAGASAGEIELRVGALTFTPAP